MKIQNILFLNLIILGLFSSCKKDYEFELEPIPNGASNFYARGQNYYNAVDHYSFDYIGGESPDSLIALEYGSASAIGEANGQKYIVSAVTLEAQSFRDQVFKADDPSGPYGVLRNGIYLKVFTDSPFEENSKKFTRAELEDIFKVGKTFTIGDLPGQVEIVLKDEWLSQETLDNMAWGFPAMRGSSNSELNTEHTVEVLAIGEYEDPTNYRYARGFTIKVKFDVTLRNHLWASQNLSLRGVEAVFLFEYE